MIDQFDRIRANNPWWGHIHVIENDSLILEFESQKLRYFHPLLTSFPLRKDAVLTLRGPRRVGKSTLLRLLIKKLLLEEKIPKEAVFFYPCDRVKDFNDLFEIIKTYLDFARPRTESRLFMFLDEISFVKDWQKAVKEMVDSGLLKNSLLLLTGSSILDIKYGSEYLSGRRGVASSDIFYYPLSFHDFVALVHPKPLPYRDHLALSYHLPLLHKLWQDFLITGGFLQTINAYYTKGRIDTLFYETGLTWIENDIHKTNRNEQTAYDLITHIIRTLTTPVSFTSLAKDSSLASHFAVQEYIDIFEKMFILFPLHTFLVEQRRRDPKKNKKIYFTDPFIFNCLYLKTAEQLEDPFAQSKKILEKDIWGSLAENAVASFLKRSYQSLYWGKTKTGEIDFVGKKGGELHYFEVKYKSTIDISATPLPSHITTISKKTLTQKPYKTIPLEVFLLGQPDSL